MVIIAIASNNARKKEANYKSKEFIVHENKLSILFGIVCMILFFLGIYTSFVFKSWGSFHLIVIMGPVCMAIFLLPGIYFTISYYRRRFIVNKDMINYCPAFGKPRTIHVSDITYVEKRQLPVAQEGLYFYHGKNKLFAVSSLDIGYIQLLNWLLQHEIRVEDN